MAGWGVDKEGHQADAWGMLAGLLAGWGRREIVVVVQTHQLSGVVAYSRPTLVGMYSMDVRAHVRQKSCVSNHSDSHWTRTTRVEMYGRHMARQRKQWDERDGAPLSLVRHMHTRGSATFVSISFAHQGGGGRLCPRNKLSSLLFNKWPGVPPQPASRAHLFSSFSPQNSRPRGRKRC